MFSKILDCPNCQFRFKFDHDGPLPESIACPSCNARQAASAYSVLVFCPDCRTKLKIPLNILYDQDNFCPQCGQPLDPETIFSETGFGSTFGQDIDDKEQTFKRLLEDGAIFDKYQIIRLLGKGGMAEVYLAEHMLLKQLCALKLMRRGSASEDPVFIKRFLREAQLSHSIDHPNIVKVFDVGSDFQTGYLFIAMEYIQGQTLVELLRARQITEKELIDITTSMAGALQALSDAGVVHRDIKPSNIMIDSNGVYRLMDLGIAKFSGNSQESALTLTMEQSTIGTPTYASPEQCRSAHSADHRSDIYSLGATLYHLASQQLPFDGATPVETILNVLQTDAKPLKDYRPDLSPRIIDLIAQMMHKDPAKRPQNSDELLAKLYSRNPMADNITSQVSGWFGKFRPAAHSSKLKYVWFILRVVLVLLVLGAIAVNLLFLGGCLTFAKEEKSFIPRHTEPIQQRSRSRKKTVIPQRTEPKTLQGPAVKPNPQLPPPEKKLPSASASNAPAVSRADAPVDKAFFLSKQQIAKLGWQTSWGEAILQVLTQKLPLVIWADNRNIPQSTTLHKQIQTFSAASNQNKKQAVFFYLDLTDPQPASQVSEPWKLISEFSGKDLQLPAVLMLTSDMKLDKLYTGKDLNEFALRSIMYAAAHPHPTAGQQVTLKRTIEKRLAERQNMLQTYEKLPASDQQQRQSAYLKKQVSMLQEQKKIRSQVQRAAAKHYSDIANRNFRNRFENLFGSISTVSLNNKNNVLSFQYQLDNLSDYLYHNNIDPNIKIKHPQLSQAQTIPAVLYNSPSAFKIRKHFDTKKIIDTLLHKNFDVNTLDRQTLLSTECINLLFRGLEDIDSEPSIALKLASYLRDSNQEFRIGNRYDMDMLCKFLLMAPAVNTVRDHMGKNLMHYAAERGDPQLIRDLLNAGLTCGKERDFKGVTPWQYAMQRGNSNTVNMMRKLNLQTPDTKTDQAQLQFCDSMRKKQYQRMRQALYDGASPYLPWVNDLNALQNACYMNDQQAVDTLLSSHVDPNRFNRISPLHVSNPLHIAAVNGNKNIVNILLRHGANPQIQSPDPKENFLLFAVSLLKTSKTCNHALPMLQTCLNFRHSTSVPMYAITSILAYCAQEPLPLFAQQPTVDIVRYLLGKYPGTLLYHQGKPLYLNATNTKVKDILRKHFNSRTMPGSTYNKRRRSVRSSGRTLIRQ